jgi:hypothetical protein
MLPYLGLETRFRVVRFDNLSAVDHLRHGLDVGQSNQNRIPETALRPLVCCDSKRQFLQKLPIHIVNSDAAQDNQFGA